MKYGPQTVAVEALIERVKELTEEQAEKLYTAYNAARNADRDDTHESVYYTATDAVRYAARGAAWYAAWNAAWDAAWNAAWDAARYAVWYAALALMVRDLITPDQFDILYGPWASVMEGGG